MTSSLQSNYRRINRNDNESSSRRVPRIPILKQAFKKYKLFSTEKMTDCVRTAGLMDALILPQESNALCGEGIELIDGNNIPTLNQKKSSLKRGKVALGCEYYLRLRNVIITIFYNTPEIYLSFERCSLFIRKDHHAYAKIVYLMLNKFGYINFGYVKTTKQEDIQARYLKNQQNKTVIIIGAGASGVVAARQLISLGIKVILLEAKNRIGGRVQSVNVKENCTIDLGAFISTGVDGNPVRLLCRQKNVEVSYLVMDDCPLYDAQGRIGKEIEKQAENQFNKLLDTLLDSKKDRILPWTSDLSLESVLDEQKAKCIHPPQNEQQRKQFKSAVEWHTMNFTCEYGTSLKNISFRHWDEEEELELQPGNNFVISEGFPAVIDDLLNELVPLTDKNNEPLLRVCFNNVANSISYFNPQRVSVVCNNGNEYFGDAVLVTVSLGILKHRSIQFKPQLPLWKTAAIDRLGFGVTNKVILWFDKFFWPQNTDYFGYCAKKNELGSDSKETHLLFFNYHASLMKPILLVLFGGEAAEDVEAKDWSVESIVAVLRRMFGDVGKLLFSHATSWKCDKHIRGSYSYVPVHGSKGDYELLAKPIGSLFFAGEATNRNHPSTVAGAMLSGMREAGFIAQSFSASQNSALHILQEYELADNLVAFLDHSELQATYLAQPYLEYPFIRKDTLLLDAFDYRPSSKPQENPSPSLLHLASCASAASYRPPTSRTPKQLPNRAFFNIDDWLDDIPIIKDITEQILEQLKLFNRAEMANEEEEGRSIATILAKKFLQNELKNASASEIEKLTLDVNLILKVRELARDFAHNGIFDPNTVSQYKITKRPPTAPLLDLD